MLGRYTELVHTHFQHSVLDSLPEWLRKMDDTYGDGLSMGQSEPRFAVYHRSGTDETVPKPDMNLPVLVYCRRDCGEITLEE